MKIKRLIFALIFILIALIIILFYFTDEDRQTRNKLEKARSVIYIDNDSLKEGYNFNIKRGLSPDGIQYGIIHFENQDTLKYWFLSHHVVEGEGGTLYELPNGTLRFIPGVFCCEVQIDSIYKSADSFLDDMMRFR